MSVGKVALILIAVLYALSKYHAQPTEQRSALPYSSPKALPRVGGEPLRSREFHPRSNQRRKLGS